MQRRAERGQKELGGRNMMMQRRRRQDKLKTQTITEEGVMLVTNTKKGVRKTTEDENKQLFVKHKDLEEKKKS